MTGGTLLGIPSTGKETAGGIKSAWYLATLFNLIFST